MSSSEGPSDDTSGPVPPTPPTGTARRLLTLAAGVVALEALAFFVLALLDVVDLDSRRVSGGLGIALLLVVYGVALLLAARAVLSGRSWARSPLVVAQLIQLLLAYNARAGIAWLPWALAVPAVVVIACLLSPPVTRALGAGGHVGPAGSDETG